jgi:hypothetical protein
MALVVFDGSANFVIIITILKPFHHFMIFYGSDSEPRQSAVAIAYV